jgi:hypothetical protein
MLKLFKTQEFIIIGISLVVTLLISSLVGVCTLLLLQKFWAGFCLGITIQVIGFAIYNTILLRNDEIVANKLFNEQLQALSKFSVKLSCAYCKQPSAPVPIQLNQNNSFKCEYCKQVSGIKMQFITTQVTTPIDNVTIPVPEGNSIEFKVTS